LKVRILNLYFMKNTNFDAKLMILKGFETIFWFKVFWTSPLPLWVYRITGTLFIWDDRVSIGPHALISMTVSGTSLKINNITITFSFNSCRVNKLEFWKRDGVRRSGWNTSESRVSVGYGWSRVTGGAGRVWAVQN
jgi:hypothetical protein